MQLAFFVLGLTVSGSETGGSAVFGPPENVRIALASEGALSFSWSTAVEASFLDWSSWFPSLAHTPKTKLLRVLTLTIRLVGRSWAGLEITRQSAERAQRKEGKCEANSIINLAFLNRIYLQGIAHLPPVRPVRGVLFIVWMPWQ